MLFPLKTDNFIRSKIKKEEKDVCVCVCENIENWATVARPLHIAELICLAGGLPPRGYILNDEKM